MNCRHCATPLIHPFIDLGFAPPSNAYLSDEDLSRPEKYYPLCVKVCSECWLAQTEDYAQADELFSQDYAYFSSTSTTWLAHAKAYTEKMIGLLDLGKNHRVIEIASNDGYLLRNFLAKGIPCLGIEPTASTALAAENLGIPVLREFFTETLGLRLVQEGLKADLIVGNNVYAHVPDVNDFTKGLKAALKPGGVITLEFPHLMRLIEQSQFDTIYHEHFSYFSLYTVERLFEWAGLRIWDVEELPTHGGSLRIYGCHANDSRLRSARVGDLLDEEVTRGLRTLTPYISFQEKADQIKYGLLEFLIAKKKEGKTVGAYGAAAKGNTLLNYAGVKPDLIPFVCDAAPSKQGKYLPGSHVPILHPAQLEINPPDYLIILPWNLVAEIRRQLSGIPILRTQLVTCIPSVVLL